MAQEDVTLFRHPDGRWVRLVRYPRRIDRMEGVKGRGLTCVYSLYGSSAAAKKALSTMRAAILREGFLAAKRLAGFVPVPVSAWRDAALSAPRKNKPSPKPGTALQARVAQLEAAAGVTLRVQRGKPATARAMDTAEKQLGRPLPPSLRTFLAEHDGLLVEWTLDEKGWGVAFEIFALRAMVKEWKRRGAILDTKAGRILPIAPTYGRSVIGAVLHEHGEAEIIEWDPPDGRPNVLAPNLAALVTKAIDDFFVVTGCGDVSEKWLPAMRRRFA